MDSVYKYGYCHRYRPGRINTRSDGSEESLQVQKWSDGWSTNWIPSDNQDSWDKRGYLGKKLGWSDSNVAYRFNDYGYRHSGPFNENRNALVALGCSLTFGIGVNYEQTWPYYVAKELGLDCINLSQPGTGINASYRAAKMWLPIIKPKAVMFYVPQSHRRELWPPKDLQSPDDYQYADYVKSIGPWSQDNEDSEFFKTIIDKREADIYREAYMDAMRWITRDSIYIHFPGTIQSAIKQKDMPAKDNINDVIIVREMSQFTGFRHPSDAGKWPQFTLDQFVPSNDTDDARWARDMVHPGPRVQRDNIAPLFIGAYRGWDNEQIDAWRKAKL